MVKVREDLTDRIFGKLKVIEQAEDYIDSKGVHKANWKCQCECGKLVEVRGSDLISKHTQSCGCSHKKKNKYIICDNYVVMYTNKGEPFYIDLEDFDKVKDICWFKNAKGYIIGKFKGKRIFLHRYVMNCPDEILIDHICTEKKYDNRKKNLRIVTNSQNQMNRKLSCNNTSGVTGVLFDKRSKKWCAQITYQEHKKHLGYFNNMDDAVKARKEAEDKYFGEWSYDNSQKIGGYNEVSTDRN